jgi:hypothetical protein
MIFFFLAMRIEKEINRLVSFEMNITAKVYSP